MRIFLNAFVQLGKLAFDLPLFKWTAAVLAAGVYYVLPTEQLQASAAGAGVLMLLDTATGFVVAWRDGVISSGRFSRVLSKILAYGSVLIVCRVVSQNVPGMSDISSASVGVAITLVICTEAVSILENVRKLGITLPFGLEKVLLNRLHGDSGERRRQTDDVMIPGQ